MQKLPELPDLEGRKRILEKLEVNISDAFMFLSVMKVKSAHEDILSIIMEEPGLKLKEIHVEDVVLNDLGSRSIRLDSSAVDMRGRHFGTDMQNDTEHDDVRRRVRYYQSLLDAPLLKSGRKTRYKNLPSTVVIFITQEDIFKQDQAKYVFIEQCKTVPGLKLGDGTTKIFLNMTSKNGEPVLVSLLQYMKDSRLDNPEILVADERIKRLDALIREIKQSEEWEEKRMSILSVGMKKGEEVGMARGMAKGMARGLAKAQLTKKVFKLSIAGKSTQEIAGELNISVEEVEEILR